MRKRRFLGGRRQRRQNRFDWQGPGMAAQVASPYGITLLDETVAFYEDDWFQVLPCDAFAYALRRICFPVR